MSAGREFPSGEAWNPTRWLNPRCAARRRAISIRRGCSSTPTMVAPGISRASTAVDAPEPHPKSRIRRFEKPTSGK